MWPSCPAFAFFALKDCLKHKVRRAEDTKVTIKLTPAHNQKFLTFPAVRCKVTLVPSLVKRFMHKTAKLMFAGHRDNRTWDIAPSLPISRREGFSTADERGSFFCFSVDRVRKFLRERHEKRNSILRVCVYLRSSAVNLNTSGKPFGAGCVRTRNLVLAAGAGSMHNRSSLF